MLEHPCSKHGFFLVIQGPDNSGSSWVFIPKHSLHRLNSEFFIVSGGLKIGSAYYCKLQPTNCTATFYYSRGPDGAFTANISKHFVCSKPHSSDKNREFIVQMILTYFVGITEWMALVTRAAAALLLKKPVYSSFRSEGLKMSISA